MNVRYAKRYPVLHEGMVEITEIPNFQVVFFHIGNYHDETRGCPLTGSYWQHLDGDYQVMSSGAAYEFFYPKLVTEIKEGRGRIEIVNALN